MSNTITGKVLAIGQAAQLPSRDPSRPFYKRELTIDCTRHDPVTGERSPYENTPVLEFAGDIVAELNTISVGDIVTVTFEVQGSKYTDRTTGEQKIFTRIRPYKIERKQGAQAQPLPFQAQPAQPTAPQAAPQYDPLTRQYVQPGAQPQQTLFSNEPPF